MGSRTFSFTVAPAQVTGLTVSATTSSSVSLSWNAISGATYRVYRNGAQVGTPAGTTYTDSGLASSTSYTYTVAAVVNTVVGAQSASVQGTTSAGDGTNTVMPSVFPLELVSPRAVGTSPIADLTSAQLQIVHNQNDRTANTNFPSAHRVNWAYPGLLYDIQIVAIGGSYPYTYAISNAPAGMGVNPSTGVITWTPSAGTANGTTYTPTVSVTDSEGTTRTSPWTITVTTADWWFLDAAAATNGSGTIDSPFNTFAAVVGSTAVNKRLYIKNGTYTAAGVPEGSIASGTVRTHRAISGGHLPLVMLAYPGHSPVYDCLSQTLNTALQRYGNGVYMEGIRVTNHYNMLLRAYSGHYRQLRRCTLDTITNPTDTANPAGWMNESGGYAEFYYYLSFIDCTFGNFGTQSGRCGAVRMYSNKKYLFHGCTVSGLGDGLGEFKAASPRWEVRACNLSTTDDVIQSGTTGNVLGGNWDAQTPGQPMCGEFRYNYAVLTNSVGNPCVMLYPSASPVAFYRNTIVGTPWANGASATSTDQRFYNNVIINNYSTYPDRIGFTPGNFTPVTSGVTTKPAWITLDANLTGSPSDGIINSGGALQGSYRTQYLGSRGHEIP